MNKNINQGLMETKLVFSIGGGIEHEAKIDVRYVVHPGSPASRVEPAEADTVEITGVYSRHGLVTECISEVIEQDEEVQAMCLIHWRARIENERDDAIAARCAERICAEIRWRSA